MSGNIKKRYKSENPYGQRSKKSSWFARYQPKHSAKPGGEKKVWTMAAVVSGLIVMLVTGSAVALSGLAHAYVLEDGTRSETVYMFPGSLEEACDRFGVTPSELESHRKEGNRTYLTMGGTFDVSISTMEGNVTVRTGECTVREILRENDIQLGANDIVEPALDEHLEESTEIQVTRVTYKTESETKETRFDVQTRDNAELLKGKQTIAQKGQYGEEVVQYRITLHDGEEAEREIVSREVIKEPVDCIIERGTREPKNESEQKEVEEVKVDELIQGTPLLETTTQSGGLTTDGRQLVWSVPAGITDNPTTKTITAGDGSTYRYTSVLEVKATAYHRIEEGGTITASGTTTQYGTIAVDPSVIPLGSRVYVVSNGGDQSWSYGPGLAEDTGGLIKGARIDLFFMTGEEAEQFGVRPAKVYILED